MTDPLYAPLRNADELPSHVKTDELAGLTMKSVKPMWFDAGRWPDDPNGEMACTAGDTDPYPGFWRCLWAFLTDRKPY